MALPRRKSRRSKMPRFTSKVKATKAIRVSLNKDFWVSGPKSIAAYRDELLSRQGGVCAILGEAIQIPCLDHDHYDGKCRGVIGPHLNLFEGQIQKLWSKHMEGRTSLTMSEVLRRLADYLEKDHSDMKFHGEVVAELKRSLKRWTKETIARNGLANFGITIDQSLDKGEMITQYVVEFVRRLEEAYLYEL